MISTDALAVANRSTTNEAARADRRLWTETLGRIARPMLENFTAGTLARNWPVEFSPIWDGRNRKVAILEALGRLSMGLASWLALADDGTPEAREREAAALALRAGITHAVDPAHPDRALWRETDQTLVDAAYLAQSFLRAPAALWEPLDLVTRQRVVAEFRGLRRIVPWHNNWVLFVAMIEVFLDWLGEEADQYRISAALRTIGSWYVGDGWYSDGPVFHMDYYNSFVIHPMLVDVLDTQRAVAIRRQAPVEEIEAGHALAVRRMCRHAEFLERMIGPDGTYPPFGRSITYRTGVFQALGHCALLHRLPQDIAPAQVRAALSAVIRRVFAMPGVFDEQGWLTLGFAGHQPGVADYYSNSGSMYIAALGFVPLGLPPEDEFWTAPPQDWTAKRAWSGQPFTKDYPVKY